MTNFEQQKSDRENELFSFEGSFEKPVLTKDEEEVINDLISCLCGQKRNINLNLQENMLIDDFSKIYTMVPTQYVDVFKYQHRDDLTRSAFRKMKKLGDYLNKLDDLTDEGEIRVDDAYLEDGNTVKSGWKNVYFKHTR